MENKIIGVSDFETVCRICLGKKENMISMFETALLSNLIKTYREILEECASVHISSADLLPKNICPECLKYLEQSYKFKIQFLSTEKLLKEIIKKNSEPNIILIDDTDYFKNEDNYFNFYDSNETSTDEVVKMEGISVKEELNEKNEELKDINDKLIDNVSKKYPKVQKYKCEECEIILDLKIKLIKHQNRIHSKTMKCMYCDKNFRSLANAKHHLPEVNRCKICKQNLGCKKILKKHLKEHLTCKICNQKFKNIDLCNDHQKIHGGKRFLCTLCGKSFTAKTSYIIHLRIHTGEKPYHCIQCDAKFSVKANLQRHSTKHSEERKFECDVCKNKFKNKDQLQHHKRNQHIDGKKYSCDICNKQFKRMDNLRDHKKIHTGEKNFICTYCDRAFMKSSNLKRHLRTHTGDKPCICSHCGKAFGDNCVLKRHMKTHCKFSRMVVFS